MVALCAITGHAQTNATAALQANTNAAPVDLGTILVEGTPISKYRAETVSTATFVDAKPEELPQTVDVLTEDFINEMHPSDLHDMMLYQPGVYTGGKSMVDRTSGQYTIRGMSGSDAMLNGTLGLAGPMGIFMDPSAFERIEIVKGPVGSTIGGATSTLGPYGAGGSANLILKQPRPDMDFINVTERSSFGEDSQRYRLGYDVNECVVKDKLTVRMPGNVEYGKPFWMPDSYRWRESYFFAPSLLWEVRDDLRIGLNLTFQYTDQPGYQGIPIYKGKPLPGYDWDSDISTSHMRDIYIGSTADSYVEWDANKVWTFRTGAGLSQADVDFEHLGSSGFATTSAPKKPTDPAVGTLYPASYQKNPYDHQEGDMLYRRYNVYERAVAKYDTGPLEHQTLFQVDYAEKNSQGRSYFSSTNNPNPSSILDSKASTKTEVDKYGFMAQDYVSWWKLRFLGGARVDEHESNLGNTGDSFSPRGGVSFLPTDWLVFFGNLSQTEAPNFGYLKSAKEELTSSWEATQYETGFRFAPVNTLWFSTTFYKIDQNNTPTAVDASNPNYSSAATYYEEEGASESKGVEFSMTGNIADNWSIFTAYAYNEYEDKTTGLTFDRYPPHAVTTSTSYRIAHGPFDDIVLGFGYRYRHKYYETMTGKFIADDFYIADSHVFDCSMDIPMYKFGGPKNVTLSLAVKNIFDEEYIESNRHYYQCFPGDPRTFEIGFQAKF
jgi:iron complex outermembrane receptor protein